MVGSCAYFDAESPYAQLLGKEITDYLMEQHVVGDFLGVFVTPDGKLMEPYAPQLNAGLCNALIVDSELAYAVAAG